MGTRPTFRVTSMGPVENMTVGYLSHRFMLQLGSEATTVHMKGLPGSAARKSLEKPTGQVLGMTMGYLPKKSSGRRHLISKSR